MTIDEYKNFSAGGPEIATKIYQHFDVHNTNCLKVNDVASEFAVMDTDSKCINIISSERPATSES